MKIRSLKLSFGLLYGCNAYALITAHMEVCKYVAKKRNTLRHFWELVNRQWAHIFVLWICSRIPGTCVISLLTLWIVLYVCASLFLFFTRVVFCVCWPLNTILWFRKSRLLREFGRAPATEAANSVRRVLVSWIVQIDNFVSVEFALCSWNLVILP